MIGWYKPMGCPGTHQPIRFLIMFCFTTLIGPHNWGAKTPVLSMTHMQTHTGTQWSRIWDKSDTFASIWLLALVQTHQARVNIIYVFDWLIQGNHMQAQTGTCFHKLWGQKRHFFWLTQMQSQVGPHVHTQFGTKILMWTPCYSVVVFMRQFHRSCTSKNDYV